MFPVVHRRSRARSEPGRDPRHQRGPGHARSARREESVGIYLDESPISVALFTPDLDLYDLDRIEVLRGPQGTLFGAGSSSGAVRYITAQPTSASRWFSGSRR
jgi:iron complex outermembrane receptor protein